MTPDRRVDFQSYLHAICRDDKYRDWQDFYTPTNAVGCQPMQQRRLNLGLQVRTVLSKEEEWQGSEEIEPFPVLERLRKYQDNHVLLVGRPGSGKSTTLQRLLWEEVEKRAGEQGSRGAGERNQIPVLVELRQYQTSVLDLIEAFLLRYGLQLDSEEIKTLLIQGRFLLLLDGLNELPSAGWRELERFEQMYRQTPMIFTSRDVGRSLGKIKTLEMQPLSETQMQQFVCAYLPESGEEMLRQLGSRLRELGQTPLLLWMLCSVYAEVGRVPTNLGAAFRAFAEIYDNRLKANVPTYQESQYWWSRLLKHLAFTMLQGQSLTEPQLRISKADAERVLRDFLHDKVPYPDDCAVRWLEDLLKYHLLQRGTDNRIEFRHQLIQEYYAAEYLWERLADISDEWLVWKYLNYLKWTEPLALMLALVEDDAQAVRVVQLALEVDLRLSARLAGEVKREFQEKTVGFVTGLEIPQRLKVKLLDITHSEWACTTLYHALDDEDSDTRRNAVYALGEIGNSEVVPVLIEALNDEDSDVRSSAVSALGSIPQPEVIAALIQALHQEDSHVRIRSSAASALEKIGNSEAVAALIEALNDKNSWVRRNAASALEKIGNSEAVAALIGALNDKDSWVRRNAAFALGKMGNPSGITALIEALHDEDSWVRRNAASALGKIGNSEAVAALIGALNDKDSWVRWRAADALEEIGNPEAVAPLIEALYDEDSLVRRSAASALDKIGNPEAVAPLIEALYDEDSLVRRSAASALGKIGNPEAIAPLIGALNDKDSWVRTYAANALGKIGNPEVVAPLIGALNDKDSWVCKSAADALGKIGNPEAIAPLIAALNDKDAWVRKNAANALGKIGNLEAVAPLIEVLHDEDSLVRKNAADALGKIGNLEAVASLIEVLHDEDSLVRKNAADALGKIGNLEAVAPLIEVLHDEDSWVRESAADALGKIGNPQVLPCLSQLLLTFATDKQDELTMTIIAIQERCKYYNYDIATSSPPQEETTANPLLYTLNSLNQTLKTMSETPKYDFSGATFGSITGSVTGKIEGDNIGTQNNYAPEQKQNLAEAAQEIQQLINQLSQTYPTTTEPQQQAVVNKAITRLKRNQPTTWQRLRNATEAALIEAFKEVLDNPFINITVAAIEGYREAE